MACAKLYHTQHSPDEASSRHADDSARPAPTVDAANSSVRHPPCQSPTRWTPGLEISDVRPAARKKRTQHVPELDVRQPRLAPWGRARSRVQCNVDADALAPFRDKGVIELLAVRCMHVVGVDSGAFVPTHFGGLRCVNLGACGPPRHCRAVGSSPKRQAKVGALRRVVPWRQLRIGPATWRPCWRCGG
jgi:hypothetical protein